jgi:predicted acyltransferase
MASNQRLNSLDALRGLTIIGMIIVNNPGSWVAAYPPLCHSEWEGCTPTDLVFPFFLFIMGFSLFISTQRRLSQGTSRKDLFIHLLKRSVLIFLIGLILNAFPFNNLTGLRILGVLQRIAIVNFFCGMLLIFSTRKIRIYTSVIILLGYWILLSFVPSPLAGYTTVAYENNWAAWLDQLILGKHTWENMPLMDPEGILSTLPAIVTGLLGIEISFLFSRNPDKREKTILLLLFGFILTTAGLAWDSIFPLIKKLWTSSYVLYTSGLASMTLGAFYWLIDFYKKEKSVWLLIAFGKNPLILYVGSELLIMIIWQIHVFGPQNLSLNDWFYESLVNAGIGNMGASLAWALTYVAFWSIIAVILFKRKIVVKL